MSAGLTNRLPDIPAGGGAGAAAPGGFRNRLATFIAAMTFYGSFLCAVSVASWVAEQIILRLAYGPIAVHWEQLRLWVPLFWLLIAAAWRRLPADYRLRLPMLPAGSAFAGASRLDAVFVFVLFVMTVVLWGGVRMGLGGMTLLALALATAWLTARREGGGQAAPPAGGRSP